MAKRYNFYSKKRKYSIYVFNNENDWVRTNSSFLYHDELINELKELEKPGTWLNKTYGHYKYKLGINEFIQGKTVQEYIKEYLSREKIKEENRNKNLTR